MLIRAICAPRLTCIWPLSLCREAGERPSGAAPPAVQSSPALLQIQPDQLQERPVTVRDHLLRKLEPRRT